MRCALFWLFTVSHLVQIWLFRGMCITKFSHRFGDGASVKECFIFNVLALLLVFLKLADFTKRAVDAKYNARI